MLQHLKQRCDVIYHFNDSQQCFTYSTRRFCVANAPGIAISVTMILGVGVCFQVLFKA